MARTIRDSILDTRAARGRLEPQGKPYYRALEEGLHLGYRKPRGRRGKPAVSGKWVARHYIGSQSYEVETIGIADDFSDVDGVAILSFRQAQDKARERMKLRAHAAVGKTGPLTVRDAVEAYLDFLESNRKSALDARYRSKAFIFPDLGDEEVDALTADRLRRWHAELAKHAPRLRTKAGEEQRHRKMTSDEDERRRRRSSANRVLTILKAALNRAWREGKVASDTAWRRVEPFEAVDAPRVRYLSIPEAQRLSTRATPNFARWCRPPSRRERATAS